MQARWVKNKWLILFFVGLIAQLIAIYYFRKTIITANILLRAYILCGLVGLLIFNRQLKTDVLSWPLKILYSIATFGGITIFLLLFLNYHFSSHQFETNNYEIVEKSYLGRGLRKVPRVYVIINKIKKDIIISKSKIDEINEATYVDLQISKGLLGYDVINNIELK